jgi:hypothetical protein
MHVIVKIFKNMYLINPFMFQKCIQPFNTFQNNIMRYPEDAVLFSDVMCHSNLLLQILSALPLYLIHRENSDSCCTVKDFFCELYEEFSACFQQAVVEKSLLISSMV